MKEYSRFEAALDFGSTYVENTWGIKAYVLSESRTGYMYNMVIYYGKETQLITKSELNHTTNDGSTCRSGL